ncbi:HNH endonuclease [Shinella sp. M27]|uniref:HNH endonuclease n=1 Tax=Shinella sp. M27 TaxID=3368614 RepID=UPI003BA311D7
MTGQCSVEGCGKPHHAHGYCSRHAYHFRAHGDATAGRRNATPGEGLRWIKEHAGYDGSGCLFYPFEKTRHGYGTLIVDGRRCVASNIMCREAHGEPPSAGMEAAHECGNRPCVNPTHLRWDTRSGNQDDKHAHGTFLRWIESKSTLSASDVLRIRQLAGTVMQKEIAAEYGVTQTIISKIISRKRWGWLTDDGRDVRGNDI